MTPEAVTKIPTMAISTISKSGYFWGLSGIPWDTTNDTVKCAPPFQIAMFT